MRLTLQCKLLVLLLVLWQPVPAAEPDTHTLQIATSLSQSTLSNQIEQQLQRAYSRLGYQINVVRLPAGRSLHMANRGVYDGELFRIGGLAEDFPALRQVAVQLATIEVLAFVKTEQQAELRNWIDLKHIRVGYVRGFRLAEKIQYAGYPVALTTLEQAVGMLEQGKIDVLLEDLQSVRSMLPAQLEQVGLTTLPTVLARAGLYHYLHERHSDLLEPLATVLKKSVPGAKDQRQLPRPTQPMPDTDD